MRTYTHILALLLVLGWSAAHAQGQLENPPDGGKISGIGLVSGWHCGATSIDIVIDDKPARPAAHGTRRGDTSDVCGDVENGFGLLVNYNLLGDGEHTIRALADGVEFDSTTFTVTTFGENFLSGESASFTLHDFPEPGNVAILEWQESSQNFVISQFNNGPGSGNQAETLRLAGTWEFDHEGPGDPIRTYYLPADSIVTRPDSENEYDLIGNDEEDENNVTAGYIASDGVWGLIDPGDERDRIFLFEFNGADRVSGCYLDRPKGSDNFSGCNDMTGVRTSTQVP